MSAMTNSNTPATERTEEARRPKRLARQGGHAMNEILRRVMPPATEDDGVSPLDVCAFNSSI